MRNLVIFLTLLICCDQHKVVKAGYNFNQELLCTGDIVFRRGNSFVSNVVLTADKSGEYSHIGILIQYGGEIMVAHAVPGEDKEEFLKAEKVDTFFESKKALIGCVCRFSLSNTQRDILNTKAIHLINSKILFDHQYNTSDSTKMYCTEFVWNVYRSLGLDISLGVRSNINLGFVKSDVIFPSQIYHHPQLEIIYKF